MNEPELESDEREALLRWASCDVPDDFADRVVEQHRHIAGHATDQLHTAELGRRSRQAARPDTWTAWWVGMIAAAAAILLALTLLARDDAPESPEDLVALRQAAGELLARECTPCHLGSSPQAEPAATAVFDLDDPQWDQRMSADQLAVATSRIADRGDANEIGGFRRYVAAELGRRGAGVR